MPLEVLGKVDRALAGALVVVSAHLRLLLLIEVEARLGVVALPGTLVLLVDADVDIGGLGRAALNAERAEVRVVEDLVHRQRQRHPLLLAIAAWWGLRGVFGGSSVPLFSSRGVHRPGSSMPRHPNEVPLCATSPPTKSHFIFKAFSYSIRIHRYWISANTRPDLRTTLF